jgi:outer membrane receptor protein involved in Fe transport
MDFNLDSMNSLKWTSRFNNNTGHKENTYYSEILDELGRPINNSTRNSNNNTDKNNITSSLLWRRKFSKPSRTLSVNTDFNWSRSQSEGLLYSLNNYFIAGNLSYRDTTDQQNITDNNNNSLSTKIAYTEPIKKDFYLELSYAFSYNNSKSDRITNFKSFNGKYEELIDSLSNSFVFNRTASTPGLNFRLNKKKHSFSFGASVAFTHFRQKNISENIVTDYRFVNFLPRISYIYKIKPNENLRINYNGSNNAPSPEQLQPTRVNTDPLNVYIGNPNLDQSFRHNFNTGYNFYNVLKEKNFWSNISVSITDNAFVQSSTIDSIGRRTYRTVNTDGVYSINLYSQYGMKIKDTKWRVGFGPEININRNIDFVNSVKNITNRSNYGLNLNLSQYVPDKYNFNIGPQLNWNYSKASVNKSANADYWSVEIYGNANINLPKKFEIGSNINAEFRQKDPRFTQRTNFTKWNAHIIKRLFKEDKMELKLSLNDILDQNRGYDRNFDSYSFTETYYNTLRRFWLLTVTWHISKNGKAPKMF